MKNKVSIARIIEAKLAILLLILNSCVQKTSENLPETHPETPQTEEGQLVNGKKEGQWKWFFDNGKLKEISHWKNNEAHGLATTFYPNGNKRTEAFWQEGRLNGKFFLFDSITEIVIEELTYVNDTLHGSVATYYNHGALEMSGTFYRGLKHGEYLYYDSEQKFIRREIWESGVVKEF